MQKAFCPEPHSFRAVERPPRAVDPIKREAGCPLGAADSPFSEAESDLCGAALPRVPCEARWVLKDARCGRCKPRAVPSRPSGAAWSPPRTAWVAVRVKRERPEGVGDWLCRYLTRPAFALALKRIHVRPDGNITYRVDFSQGPYERD